MFSGGPPSIHSYDAGYITGYPDGLVWLTAPGVIPLDAIDVHLGEGTAELQFEDVAVLDWTTALNSLSNGALLGAPADATMSIDIQWSNITRKVFGVSDETNGFQGDFLETEATVDVEVANADGFSFSGSGDASKGFAEIGHEQNGSFFGVEEE